MNFSSPNALWTLPATLRHSKAQARGFSLLEVAIALVIFVFGALAIVRIFPGALRVITVGGTRQNALNLNRAAMTRVQQNTPPLATYDVGNPALNPTGFSFVDGYQGDNTVTPNIPAEPRAVLGSTSRGYSLPRSANLQDYDVSALGSMRAIIGEGATVRTDGTNLLVLTQFPIADNDGNPAARLVERGKLDGATITKYGTVELSNARWADSGAPFTAFTGATFYVSFRYQNGGNLWGAIDYPSDPTTTDTTANTTKLPAIFGTTYPVVAGQVEVTCQHDIGILSPPASLDDEGRGIINVTANVSLSSPQPMQGSGTPTALAAGDKVFVDYQADWSRVLQEGAPDIVPESLGDPLPTPAPVSPHQIALTAPFIEDHANDAVFTALYTKSGNTFTTFDRGKWGEGVPAQGMLSPTQGDLRASRITFDMAAQPTATARVSYRTRDQWAQQLSVAASSYKPFTDGSVEPWRDYYLDGSVLYFHASEAGKSVMVTYSYFDGGSNITLRNRLLSIEDEPRTQAPSGFGSSKFAAKLQLTDAEGNELSAPHSPLQNGDFLSISGVRGASVTVRTAWLDGSRYTQSFLTAMRAGTSAEAMP